MFHYYEINGVCSESNRNNSFSVFLCCSTVFFKEHGEQCHLQRPAHNGVQALLQSGPLQQTDDRRLANLSAGDNHREQDRCPYRHFQWTPAAGPPVLYSMFIMNHTLVQTSDLDLLCVSAACTYKIQSYYFCQLFFGGEQESVTHRCHLLIRVSSLCGWR